MLKVYLDAHATTPVVPEAITAMQPYFAEYFGNPSSEHSYGWKAKAAVDKAKQQVADLIGCQANQVYFTSGATESLHWLIMGWARKNPGGKIITSATEHKATYGACDWGKSLGCETIIVPVDPTGRMDLEILKSHLDQTPTLITFIHGNNEIGTLNPVTKIVELAKSFAQTQVHLDAAQSVGKMPVSFAELGVDYLSFSGHKLYAPKGIGTLIIKDKANIAPLFLGGGQQQGMRAGTLNVPAIVGLGAACEWCGQHLIKEHQRLTDLRNRMLDRLLATGKVQVNGHPSERLPHNLNLTFNTLSPDKLLLALPGVAFSASSACSSSNAEPSQVLTAIGLKPEQIRSTVRFGLSFETTQEQLDAITDKILEILAK